MPSLPASLTTHLTDRAAALVDRQPLVRELGLRFALEAHELYLVGGSVRDALLGRDVAVDLDFTTSARPEQTERLLAGWADAVWLTGAAFGTVSAEKDQVLVEVTTFRSDAYTPGSRHPEVVYGETVEQDLTRRDFTVNALALDVASGELVDRFGGVDDLVAGMLRTPVEPRQSFDDDPLRMLRLARFAATLGFEPEAGTLAAATAMAAELQTISAERIRVELLKLLTAATPDRGVAVLVATGLLAHVPGLEDLATAGGVLARRFATPLPAGDGVDPEALALALACFDLDAIARRLRRLTCSNDTRKLVERVVAHARGALAELADPTDALVRRTVAALGADEPTFLALTTRLDDEQPGAATWVARYRARRAVLAADGELDDLDAPIDGVAIMERLGTGPGRHVGEIVRRLRERRLEHGRYSADEALAEVDAWAREQAGPA